MAAGRRRARRYRSVAGEPVVGAYVTAFAVFRSWWTGLARRASGRRIRNRRSNRSGKDDKAGATQEGPPAHSRTRRGRCPAARVCRHVDMLRQIRHSPVAPAHSVRRSILERKSICAERFRPEESAVSRSGNGRRESPVRCRLPPSAHIQRIFSAYSVRR